MKLKQIMSIGEVDCSDKKAVEEFIKMAGFVDEDEEDEEEDEEYEEEDEEEGEYIGSEDECTEQIAPFVTSALKDYKPFSTEFIEGLSGMTEEEIIEQLKKKETSEATEEAKENNSMLYAFFGSPNVIAVIPESTFDKKDLPASYEPTESLEIEKLGFQHASIKGVCDYLYVIKQPLTYPDVVKAISAKFANYKKDDKFSTLVDDLYFDTKEIVEKEIEDMREKMKEEKSKLAPVSETEEVKSTPDYDDVD